MKEKRLLAAVVLFLGLMGVLVAFSALHATKSVGDIPDSAIMWVPICLDADRARTSPWNKLCPPSYPRLSSRPAGDTNQAEVAFVPICLEYGHQRKSRTSDKLCPPIYPYPLE